jgi:hypothetical protein
MPAQIKLPREILQAALEGLEQHRQRINQQIDHLKGLIGGKSSAVKPARKRRRMSAEGRKRIAEAARRRWAKQRKQAKAA